MFTLSDYYLHFISPFLSAKEHQHIQVCTGHVPPLVYRCCSVCGLSIYTQVDGDTMDQQKYRMLSGEYGF